jgi:hypothetical protein
LSENPKKGRDKLCNTSFFEKVCGDLPEKLRPESLLVKAGFHLMDFNSSQKVSVLDTETRIWNYTSDLSFYWKLIFFIFYQKNYILISAKKSVFLIFYGKLVFSFYRVQHF